MEIFRTQRNVRGTYPIGTHKHTHTRGGGREGVRERATSSPGIDITEVEKRRGWNGNDETSVYSNQRGESPGLCLPRAVKWSHIRGLMQRRMKLRPTLSPLSSSLSLSLRSIILLHSLPFASCFFILQILSLSLSQALLFIPLYLFTFTSSVHYFLNTPFCHLLLSSPVYLSLSALLSLALSSTLLYPFTNYPLLLLFLLHFYSLSPLLRFLSSFSITL